MKMTGCLTAQAIVWSLVLAVLGGCMSTTPKWDQHFGQSLHRITVGQTLHPATPQADEQPQGTGAEVMVRAQEQYLHSFEAPPEPKTYGTTR